MLIDFWTIPSKIITSFNIKKEIIPRSFTPIISTDSVQIVIRNKFLLLRGVWSV